MSLATSARGPQPLSSGRNHSSVNDLSQMVMFLLVLVLVLVDRLASLSHSSAQISRKPRVAEVTRQVADVTRRVHEMGGVGSNPSELGFHPLYGFEVPQSILAAPQAFLGRTLLGTVIPSTGYEPFFTDADPTSHRVRLWRGGSASKVLLLRVFFPRVRPRGCPEVCKGPWPPLRGRGEMATLPVWFSTSGRYIRCCPFAFLLSARGGGSGHDVPAPGWEVRLAPLSPCPATTYSCRVALKCCF